MTTVPSAGIGFGSSCHTHSSGSSSSSRVGQPTVGSPTASSSRRTAPSHLRSTSSSSCPHSLSPARSSGGQAGCQSSRSRQHLGTHEQVLDAPQQESCVSRNVVVGRDQLTTREDQRDHEPEDRSSSHGSDSEPNAGPAVVAADSTNGAKKDKPDRVSEQERQHSEPERSSCHRRSSRDRFTLLGQLLQRREREQKPCACHDQKPDDRENPERHKVGRSLPPLIRSGYPQSAAHAHFWGGPVRLMSAVYSAV